MPVDQVGEEERLRSPASVAAAEHLTDPLVDPLMAFMGPAAAAAPPTDPLSNPFGSMGDGKGGHKSGATVLQKVSSVRSGEHRRAGGRAHVDWKGGITQGFGVQKHHADGSSSGRRGRNDGKLKGGFNSWTTDEAEQRNGRFTAERTRETKGREYDRRTEQREVRNTDGQSFVEKKTKQTDFDGKKQSVEEASWSGKKRGHHTVRREGQADDGSHYRVGKTGPSTKQKIKDGFGSLKEKINSTGRSLSGKKKRQDLKPTGPTQASKKSAWDEGDGDIARDKHSGLNSLLRHVTPGAVGDETGIDYESFKKKRENRAGAMQAENGRESIGGGFQDNYGGAFGASASGDNVQDETWTDESGRKHNATYGGTGEVHAGFKAQGSTHDKWTPGGREVGATGEVSAGAGGEGAIGTTRQSELGHGFSSEVGATMGGSFFGGARAKGNAKATHSSSKVSAEASGEAMVGAEVSGHAGTSAGIKIGGMDIVAARAKASGDAFAGAKATANGKAEAGFTKVGVSGSADATAGAKAEGKMSAGVTAGFVDVDAVAEGEALAGAEAHASGEASIGLTGMSLGGTAGAFAGAKAGGQVRAELGAGGLNFGLIGVSGEVSAGAGAEATGKVFAGLAKTGAEAEAAAALGVGAGAGMLLSIDPSFPLRLPLQKLHENGVIPTSDVGALASSAMSGVYKPADGSKDLTLDEARSKASPERRKAIDAAADTVKGFGKEAGSRAFGEVKAATQMGGGLLTSVLGALTQGFAALTQVGDSTTKGLTSVVGAGIREAGGLFASLKQAGSQAMASISSFKGLSVHELLEGNWQAGIDRVVSGVATVLSTIVQGAKSITERVRKAGHALIDSTVDAGAGPLLTLGNSVGNVVGAFGSLFGTVGSRMLGQFQAGSELAERGVAVDDGAKDKAGSAAAAVAAASPVSGTAGESGTAGDSTTVPTGAAAAVSSAISADDKEKGGRVALPLSISPVIGVARGLVGGLGALMKGKTVGMVNDVGAKLTGTVKTSLKDHHDNHGLGSITKIVDKVAGAVGAIRGSVSKIAAGVKAFLAPIVKAARAAAAAAKKVAKAVAGGAKKVGKAIASGAKKVFGWFTGLFK